MDRTIIAPWKAEEKEQSEKLYKKLQGLSLLYPMNDEMVKLLSWDMFLKPNQPAFFQMMHYLFRIVDPVEFKRRFFWPITDKKSEANFRSSTIDYLKHLNEKHNLHWTNIKSYLVVMPGGMKFIKFLLDLVGFVVQELIKQREHVLTADTDPTNIRNCSAQWMLEHCAFMKEYASAYIEEAEEIASELRDCAQKIRHKFTELTALTGVSESLLQDNSFLLEFDAHNRNSCEQKITLPIARIAKLEAPLCAQKEAMDQFQTKRAEHKQNNEAADEAIAYIQKFFGNEACNLTAGNAGRMNALLSGFNSISKTIAEQLDANNHYSECNEFVTADLKTLRGELEQIHQQLSEVQKNLNVRAKRNTSGNSIGGNVSQTQHSSQLVVPSTPLRTLDTLPRGTTTGAVDHPLFMKFVSTPPIRPEMASGVRNVHVRLPLQDDFNAKQFENSLLAPRPALAPPRSVRKINTTMNRSKIVDPMQLLRTIAKSSNTTTNTQLNISAMGSKWKHMQSSFSLDEVTVGLVSSPKSNTASTYSPFTPLTSNDRTRIERLPPADDSTNSSLYAKKSAAMMKVLDSSLNVQNLSTSPSGRLDALVAGPLPEQIILPRIQLNDQTLNDSKQLLCSSKESDVNPLNALPPKFCLDLSDCADIDDLQNISDTVLKDISI
ncbi:augmin complex subunit dgt6 [Drosophila grimshawi]|uniref:GH21273 n=1 Tax=Drosophila grimshawi TaxID=7222 RepID=B4JRQ9_DROGR|nr:augmin complex subunit dgt6 [Drosophila grimshawi]EDV94449.1 GH21273 [Drosophila grimshawi]